MSIERLLKERLRHLITLGLPNRVHLVARRAAGQNVEHLFYPSVVERFSAIYRNRVWLCGRSSGALSGLGSEIANTQSIRACLSGLLKNIGCDVLVDIGCGDFTWMKEVQLPCRYIGVDIVPEVIAANKQQYGSTLRSFTTLDVTRDPVPRADAVLCREVMFHLSFADIRRLIHNGHQSGASYLLATTDPTIAYNADILSGDYRMLNIEKPPLNFPRPILTIPDDAVVPGRLLALWQLSSLPGIDDNTPRT